MEKLNTTIEFCIFKSVLVSLLPKKGYFLLKTEKVSITIELYLFKLV